MLRKWNYAVYNFLELAFSLSRILWRLIPAVTYIRNDFYCCFLGMEVAHLFHQLPIKGYLVVYNFGMLWIKLLWTLVDMFLCDISFHLSGINAQECNHWVVWLCMLSFIRNCQIFFQSDCFILHSHQLYMTDTIALHPCQASVLLNFGRCIVASHCGFN